MDNKKNNKNKKQGSLEGLMSESFSQKINNFVRTNAYVLTIGIALTFVVLNMRLSSLADKIEETLVKNTEYIKKNISTPVFLSATGQVLTIKKSPMGYDDERFKGYIKNLLSDIFVVGLVKLSSNYSIRFKKAEDIIIQNKRFKEFFTDFTNLEAGKELIDTLYWSVVEGRLPEYVDLTDSNIEKFRIKKTDKDDPTVIEGNILFSAVAKSWIVDMSKWDTRAIKIRFNFTLVIDVFKYGNVSNPFGIHFTSISMPIPNKPKGRGIIEETRK